MLRKLFQPNRPSARRRGVLVGFLLVTGVIYLICAAHWIPMRYTLLLEGKDERGHYLTMLAVASQSQWQARALALSAAREHRLNIVEIVEIEAKGPAPLGGESRVLRAPWQKAYFEEAPENGCEHKHSVAAP
jgi:hypothetical protein